MERRLTQWVAGKLILGHKITTTSRVDGYTQAVEMSPVDGKCYATDWGGIAMRFDDPWKAAAHIANRRMQGWITLGSPDHTRPLFF